MSIRNDNLPEMAAALWLDECQSERGNDFRYGDDSGISLSEHHLAST